MKNKNITEIGQQNRNASMDMFQLVETIIHFLGEAFCRNCETHINFHYKWQMEKKLATYGIWKIIVLKMSKKAIECKNR